MRKSITIELKYEGAEGLEPVIRQAAREAARTLFTAAILVSAGRQPVIAVQSEDFYDGTEDIDVNVDEEDAASEEDRCPTSST